MALKDNQCAEIEACIEDIRESAKMLIDYDSEDESLDRLAEHLGESLNRLAAVVRVMYGELRQIGNVIYDV